MSDVVEQSTDVNPVAGMLSTHTHTSLAGEFVVPFFRFPLLILFPVAHSISNSAALCSSHSGELSLVCRPSFSPFELWMRKPSESG